MKVSKLLICVILLMCSNVYGQHAFYGEVKDSKTRNAIAGAIVLLSESPVVMVQADVNGHFHFYDLLPEQMLLKVSQLGYKTFEKQIIPGKNKHITVYLEEQPLTLNEVVINSRVANESSLSLNTVGKTFILENNASSLAKTLSKLSGVSSMDIGSGFSKPVIRGLGFNRVAVIDKGITQQDQQWGADHGLGIDQYDVDEVIVHKGPMSLQFGSDAIGGAIEIKPPRIPFENCYFGDLLLIGKTNNDLTGLSFVNSVKQNNLFIKARYTYQRYSDYRVPADSLNYLNMLLPIHNNRLKNTAGEEHDASAFISFSQKNIHNKLFISNVYQKNGFFPGAHGVPDASRLQHDGSYRNIEMPYNNVNHFKVIDNFTVVFNENTSWITDAGFQYNHRQEWSAFHTHYDNQQAPLKDPDLELDFRLQTYTLNSKLLFRQKQAWKHTIGLQTAFQHHDIKGYNYLMPAYKQFSAGAYWISGYKLSPKWTIEGGVRFDYAFINITGFYDTMLAEYLQMQGYDASQVQYYAQRAYGSDLHFNNFSASVGSIYNINTWSDMKINVGKSFRFPTANELASNGVHHGAFRHEQGDPDLKQEQGYQLDVSYRLQQNRVSLNLSPYAAYFTNYIYLSPQGEWSVLPHAGQLYKYSMAEAVFAGAEYQFQADIFHLWEVNMTGQYVWNKNLTDHYPLPFTPPFSMRNEIVYTNKYKFIESYRVSLEHQFYAPQNRIARNEEKTPGTHLFNAGVNAHVKVNKFRFMAGLQVQNIFNTKYMNHLSFYRKLGVPEPGRNIQLLLRIPFFMNMI